MGCYSSIATRENSKEMAARPNELGGLAMTMMWTGKRMNAGTPEQPVVVFHAMEKYLRFFPHYGKKFSTLWKSPVETCREPRLWSRDFPGSETWAGPWMDRGRG